MSSTSSLIYSSSSLFNDEPNVASDNKNGALKAESLTLDFNSTFDNNFASILADDIGSISPLPTSNGEDKMGSKDLRPSVLEYVDFLYSKLEKRSPGFAERGCQDWLPYMQADHHRTTCNDLVTQWIIDLGTVSSDVLMTRESSALFVKSIDYISTKVTAILLQIYRDAPGSFWKPFDKKLAFDVRSMFSFLYLFCFTCLFGALECTLTTRKFYFLFLQSLAEYLISDGALLRLEKDFFYLFEGILEQRQVRLKSLISQSLLGSTNHKGGNLQLLNEYYTVAIEGSLSSISSLNASLYRIESWRPSPADLMTLVESLSHRPFSNLKAKRRWPSWIRLISVPMVTAALVVFTRLLKNGLLGRRVML
ncbi:hypothetical protein MDAP_001429 [Mitosporidium daphniae]|uniref:Uncharacterized protein n=1 Tax=Mitosporidium daphniae TaxID=1485682 RepID=A0A098VQ57_9MICR|nr:uncharacterized protein DI09_50p110 [Mitosporidium daphniae]KGG50904.1 hypothetical protein DI09_50p110 [Mitosporidium daphniae]|eukprot:XP_013237331.1 uncharacterized protein DI09_50p110 [Mitosporidium daphniae]